MTDKRAAALRIAADTGHDPRSVLAVFEGRRVLPSTRKAVEAAADRLGIALPTPPTPAPVGDATSTKANAA